MFQSNLINQIADWKSADGIKICIGCDIGGSGLRVRLSDFKSPQRFVDLGHCKAQSTADALKVLNDLKNKIQSVDKNVECKGAALAVAGPIKDDTVVLTNWLGKPSVRTLTLGQLPHDIFPVGKSIFLNDLEAGAYGVVAADKEGILEENFEQMWPSIAPKGPLVSNSRTAVLAMGSGLGVALILKPPTLNQPLVMPTELGHLQIPALCQEHPDAKEEYKLIQHVSDHYYAGRQTPEFEDIASGRGLTLTYQHYHLQSTGQKIPLDQISAGEIASLARNGDKDARRALLSHYLLFMRSAKAVATTMSCDSVLLALDNQVKNAWFVTAEAEQLRKEFYTFIRPDWMKGIRVYAQTKVLNFNILGTDYMAHQLASK